MLREEATYVRMPEFNEHLHMKADCSTTCSSVFCFLSSMTQSVNERTVDQKGTPRNSSSSNATRSHKMALKSMLLSVEILAQQQHR